jgi:alpha-amylase
VHPAFWREFNAAAGDMFMTGEVDAGDVTFVAPWQAPSGANAALPSVLSYPLFFTLRNVFAQKQSMRALSAAWAAGKAAYADPSLLGVFTDNHDNARFMHVSSDKGTYRAAVAYSLLSDGVPIVYYGSEWLYAGGNDPGCREPLWCPGISYNSTAAPLGPMLAALNGYRKAAALWKEAQEEALVDDAVYAFTKGATLAVFTNVGVAGAPQARTILAAALPAAWTPGTLVCDLLDCAAPCLAVDAAGLAVTVRGDAGAAVFGTATCSKRGA